MLDLLLLNKLEIAIIIFSVVIALLALAAMAIIFVIISGFLMR